MKRKRNLLETTHILTEGFVGGQKINLNKKTSDTLNKDKLIRETILKLDLSAKNRSSESSSVSSDSKLRHSTSSVELKNKESESLNSSDSEREDEGVAVLAGSNSVSEVNERDILEGRVRLTEQQVTSFIKDRRSWPKFEEVFMISALDGTGVDEVRELLLSSAYSSPWIFSSQVSEGD